MNSVQRTKGIKKIIRRVIFRKPVPKFMISGDQACEEMMRKARSRRQSTPSNQAILTWARCDLTREILSGFWEILTV